MQKKEKVIWGAGYIGGKQFLVLGKDNVAFFIDNSEEKCKSTFCGKPVKKPSDIEDWARYFVYVPENYYAEISDFLKRQGREEGKDFTSFSGTNYLNWDLFIKNYDEAIENLLRNKKKLSTKTLFWGWNFRQKSNYKAFFDKMYPSSIRNEIGVLAENVWEPVDDAEAENGVATIMAPYIFDRDCFIVNAPMLSEEKQSTIRENFFYSSAVEKTLYLNEGKLSYNEAAYTVYMMIQYARKVVEILNPKMVIIVGSRTTKSDVLRGVQKELDYQLMFTHPGFLAGTLIFDAGGDSAEGAPNINPDAFMNLPIDKREIKEAISAIDYIRDSGINRKVQPQNNIQRVVENRIKPDRPTVLFAAQVDTDLLPKSDYIKKMYSPVFSSSMEAGVALSQICKKNNWNYIFKSHPLYIRDDIESKLAEGSIYVPTGNINELVDISDVVITIQSSTSYVGLIRNKPVVMLGYDQLRDKGITYQAYNKECIESTISDALTKGFLPKQKKHFERFIAICLKYYLYNSGENVNYGMSPPRDVNIFNDLRKKMEEKSTFAKE